jgi:dUTP pyrophosphatase
MVEVGIEYLPEYDLEKWGELQYATEGSAGFDLRAAIRDSIKLFPSSRVLVPAGIKVQIPKGFEMQIRPRSGLAVKNGITVLNSPGTVDSDFRGIVQVIVVNLGQYKFEIQPGDRIAQAVINEVPKVRLWKIASVDETDRGAGGFGSTGVK